MAGSIFEEFVRGEDVKVYLNGAFVEEDHATISIDDRGFLFADGVYEVVHVYNGRLFAWNEHMERLERSLDGIEISGVDTDVLAEAASTLLAEFSDPEGALYIQITRGVQKRSHAPPASGTVAPTVLMWVRPVSPISEETIQHGVSMITVPDDRWAKVWIKTVGLLPNVLAKGKAVRQNAFDAIFIRDGIVMEATAANVFIVKDGVLGTAPVTNYILPGITRAVVLDIAAQLGISVDLRPFTTEQLYEADEAFLTGTLTEVLPIAQVDGRALANPSGPIARRLLQALHERAAKV